MNKFFPLLGVLLLCFSCTQNPEAQTTAPAAAQETVKKSIPTPVADPVVATPPSRRYAAVTSRNPKDIKKEYPFDIPLTDATGEKFNSATAFETNGKPTVLVFWLTTCVPCHYELAAMKKKYAQWQAEADFNFYAISTDFQKNYEKYLAQCEKNQWEWDVFHDTDREFRSVMPGALNGLPQSFILDKNGEIVYHKRKYTTGDEDKLFAKVKELAMK